jgi:uncharacterized repeat protein (TIGR01451 family)
MPAQATPEQQHRTASHTAPNIRRRLIVVAATILLALALTGTVLAVASAAASAGPARADLLVAQVQLQALSPITVNYAHEWVAGNTDPSASVAVTVTDNVGALKADAVVTADDQGDFFVECANWSSGQCPDIQPGDHVTVTAPGALAAVDPVGSISGELDAAENTVAGVLHADALSGMIDVRCEVWIESGPDPITATADADGGTFTCDFDDVGWDLEPPQTVAVMYVEPDGDTVINVLSWPSMRVNYAHDWVGGNYEAGHTFWITVTEGSGPVKANAIIDSAPGAGWGGDGFETQPQHWSPEVPDIVPGDWVHFTSDDGYTNTIQVGLISGTLDIGTDSVGGPIYASFPQTLPVECDPWGAWDAGMGGVPAKQSEAAPDGSVPFSCAWDSATEWDIVPGQDVAVIYWEPDGDAVLDVYREPAPYLRVEKWLQGQPGEGGNVQFALRYWNEGDAPAEDVVLTDTLEGMAYLGDTSGFSHTGGGPGPIVWSLGTVDPGTDIQFDLFAAVTASAPDPVTNTLQIATSNPYDQGDAGEKVAQWNGTVASNDTHLNVGKSAWTGDPAPDTDVVFAVNVCNNGPTGSSIVTLTDVLHPDMSLVNWWGQTPGWYEVSSDAGQLVAALPSLPGSSCSEVYLVTHVAPEVESGGYLTNTAFITATNDVEPDDNQAFWEGNANDPHPNMNVGKWWNGGQLVPGGELRYGIGYGNDGNVPVGSFRITDTFPISTTFVRAWHNDPSGGYEFAPLILTDGYAVWEIPGLDNGYNGDFEVVLAVDPGAVPDTLLVNTVELTPLPGEDTYEDNTAQWTEVLYPPGEPNLRVVKWHNWNGDGRLDYQVQFANIGAVPVSGFWITDTLPLGTQWTGEWHMDFDQSRLVAWDYINGARTLIFLLSEIQPGEAGWLYFGADLDDPGVAVRWYTNTVEISTPLGDPNPGDNVYDDVAFSGGEVRRAEFWLSEADPSHMWGEAVAGSTVTVTTPLTQVFAWADPGCGGCWDIEDAGMLYPGDEVEVVAGEGLLPVVVTIPDPLIAEVDTVADEVYGQIGGWSERPVEVHGNWPDGYRQVPSDPGGNFLASYPGIPRGADGYVRIMDEVDYAQVIYHRPFAASDLLLTVDYDHDWVGAEYEAGHTIALTVTDSVGGLKATAMLDTLPEGGWWSTSGEQWSPQQPDIVPGDWVSGAVDGGTYATEVQVGTIDGEVDVDADTVSGTLDIPWLSDPLFVSCEVHEEMGPEGIGVPDVDPKGGSFLCDFSTVLWDIVPGQNVAVNYTEPDGDRVQAHPPNPAPYLRVEKWSDSQPAEGGNLAFHVRYYNQGGLPAEGVVLTDTLEGMAYLNDTSGLSHTGSGSGPIAWDIGTMAPGADVQFDLFVEVTASAPGPVTNTLQIATSSPFDQGDPGEKIAQWSGEVLLNDTYLNVNKWAWTPNPAPDTDFVFQISVCNNGSTASSAVVLTDTVHPSMTVGIWWSNDPGWKETYSDAGQVALVHPSIPSSQCGQVYLRVHLDAAAWPGMPITNTVAIYSASDLDGSNETTWESQVGEPQVNLWVDKSWASGQLVPGGQLHYDVQVGNDGNVAVGETILITDALPAYTAFDSLWLHDQDGAHPVTPTLVGPDQVTWEIAGLDNGYAQQFELVLNVDGDAPAGAVLTNTSQISCLPDEGCADNTSAWVETLYDHGPNLRVRKDGRWDDWGQDTRRATYWVTVENVGDVRVDEAFFVDTYPEQVAPDSPLEADWTHVSDWGLNGATNTLTATIENLGPGERTWGTSSVIVPGTGPLTGGMILTNTAMVMAVPGEPTEDNVDVAVLTTGPDLVVQKELVAGELLPGGLVTYSLSFGNDRLGHEWWWGMQGNAWLTDTLPAGATLITGTLHSCGESEWCTFLPADDGGTHLVWELWPLGAAEWNEIYVTLRVPEAIEAYDLLTNTVEIASDHPISDAEPYLDNNVAEHVAVAALPSFEVGKSYDSSRVAGTAITYTLSVTNTGNGVGTGVVLSDVLPGGLFYRAGDGTFDGTAVRWEVPSIAAEGGVASGWFSATLGCALGTVSNDDYRVVTSDQDVGSAVGPAVSLDVVAPSIDLALTPPAGHIVAGDVVYVTATASTNGSPLRYTWDWSDGPAGGGLSASHAYPLDGSYTVVLTATDDCAYAAAVSATIDVAAPVLVPSFDYDPVPAHVTIGWPVLFTDTTTTDGPAVVAWHWDFGDGSSATGAHASHAYLEDGTFTVTLTVTDALGYSAQHTAPGLVTVSSCVALTSVSLAYAPLEPLVGMPLVLTATVAPPDATGPVTYEWDLGDGTTQTTTAASIVHTYTAGGPVEVHITATNGCTPAGVSDQESIVIGLRRIYLPVVMRNH